MKVETFNLERMQSTYENTVDFNLSESGVQPLQLGDLLDDGAEDRIAAHQRAAGALVVGRRHAVDAILNPTLYA